jgi:hypothetical protein
LNESKRTPRIWAVTIDRNFGIHNHPRRSTC